MNKIIIPCIKLYKEQRKLILLLLNHSYLIEIQKKCYLENKQLDFHIKVKYT